jgi:hypothetical protein
LFHFLYLFIWYFFRANFPFPLFWRLVVLFAAKQQLPPLARQFFRWYLGYRSYAAAAADIGGITHNNDSSGRPNHAGNNNNPNGHEEWLEVVEKAGQDSLTVLYWIIRNSAERFGQR